ncbi:MAG: nicotinate-nucleotide--dimethylbenzimidazole phosphoribosyltransferase [Fimbriimonadaceae bacterium]|nr:nicotinate-nucleotide--dimethylbenzimidazole phosphoribosyltransferase [Alphaproteobacteria bacterium]
MSKSITDIADFERRLSALPDPDLAAQAEAAARQEQLTKPPGSLGRLEDLAIWMASWQGKDRPQANKIETIIFAGNHGVVARGVSAYPSEVTVQMVGNFEAGGAAINQLCAAFGAGLKVIAIDLDKPTGDIAVEPAMSQAECLAALNIGIGSVADDVDLLVLGEMGIGNTTIAAALSAACLHGSGKDWAGPGTGVDRKGVSLKADAVKAAIACHDGTNLSAFETMRCLGGRETAAIAGAVLAAREKKIPVLLDGFVCCAAVAPLHAGNRGALDHCLAGHVSAEPGHWNLLRGLNLEPLLDLNMRLGEGSGAALAVSLIKAALAVHNGMATFAEAGVSNRED